MNAFKKTMEIMNRTFGAFGFGFGASNLFRGNYKVAAFSLLIVSILFMVGYFAERWSD